MGPETSTLASGWRPTRCSPPLLPGPGEPEEQLKGSLEADRLPEAVPEGRRQRPRMFQEAVDRGVPREALDEGAAGVWILLARLEEQLEHPKVRDEVD